MKQEFYNSLGLSDDTNKISTNSYRPSSTAGEDDEENTQCFNECMHNLRNSDSSKGTFCSKQSEKRGPGQRVVSFSFYGELKSAYFNGIAANLNSIQNFYPGWLMRLYVDSSTLNLNSSQVLCDLSCNTNRLDLCPVNSVGNYGDLSTKFGMVWRFLPMADKYVDFMLSRDLDSRFSDREQAAVADWIQTGLPFHAMRDHPNHGTAILGGMWGARMDLTHRKKYEALISRMLGEMSSSWGKGYDQVLLSQYVWPSVKEEACVHDSYLCTFYPAPHNRPWPTRRKNESANFVGSIGDMKIMKSCPVKCRPNNHQDWTMC